MFLVLFINYPNSNTKKMIFDLSFFLLLILLAYLQFMKDIITLTQKKQFFGSVNRLLHL